MDGQAIKDFFAKHVEKIVLVGVAGISGFLLYQGINQPMYDKQEPATLESMARQVKTSVDEDHTAAIMEERQVEADFVEQVAKSQSPVPEEPYKAAHLWDPRPTDSSIKRQDPQLLAPAELRVTGVVGALALRSDAESYRVADLENADPVEKEKPKPPRRSRRSPAAGSEGYGGAGSYGSEPGMEPGSGYAGEMLGSPGGPGGAMGGVGMTQRRTLYPDYNEGYKPQGVGGGGALGSVAGAGRATGPGVEPQLTRFIAGTAVMPHKKLMQAYEAAFRDAVEYKPMRDRPTYLTFEVQRADVTTKPVDQLEDGDWTRRYIARDYNELALRYWTGFAPEIVPGDYRDPNLTAVIPPLLIYDYTRFSLHPLVPLKSMAELQRINAPVRRGPAVPDAPFQPGQGDLFSDPSALLRNAMQGVGGGYSGSGGYGEAAGGYSGSGGYSGAGGYSGSGGYGGAGGYGGFGPGMAASGRPASETAPEYKLIRFYDFEGDENSPRPGRQYVYRVRVALEDPNFPAMRQNEPSLRSLAPEVYQRVAVKRADSETKKKRDYWIWTDWSDPSPKIELPELASTYAGPVEPASTRTMTVQQRQIEYVRTPPRAKMVAVEWSPEYATAIPAPMNDVTIGSVLNTEQPLTAEVVDPITTTIKKLPDAHVQTNAVVLDIVGGEDLVFIAEEEQTKPGMILVFGPGGELEVREEISDRRKYRMHTYAEERESATAAPAPGGGYDTGGGAGYGSGGGVSGPAY